MNLRALVAFFAALLLWSALGSPAQARELADADGSLMTLCSTTEGGHAGHGVHLDGPQDEPPAAPLDPLLDPLLDGVELLPPSDLAQAPCRVPARAEPMQAKALTSAWLAALMRPPCLQARQA